MKQTRADAICTLIADGSRKCASVTSYKRCIRACRTLGLESAERARILCMLEYTDENGLPHVWLANKLLARR